MLQYINKFTYLLTDHEGVVQQNLIINAVLFFFFFLLLLMLWLLLNDNGNDDADDYRLRVEMVTWDEQPHWAEYRHFRLSSESNNFRLHVAGFVPGGTAGDSLTSAWDNDHDGQPFSTYDK